MICRNSPITKATFGDPYSWRIVRELTRGPHQFQSQQSLEAFAQIAQLLRLGSMKLLGKCHKLSECARLYQLSDTLARHDLCEHVSRVQLVPRLQEFDK